jgi:drug/metabolite transporter (DMT)-like permease
MNPSRTTLGLFVAIFAAFSFGTSGALVKPLLEAGWSPAAAVTLRALIGGVVLTPFALVSLRGKWSTLWRARWRILVMALIGVAGTQLAYFAAVQRVPVSTAILIEYMSPLLLVVAVWVRMRRMPRVVVLIGSVVALAGLVLVVSPFGAMNLDVLGLVFASLATVGSAVYFVVAARPSEGLPPVAFAASGLLIGGVLLGLIGLTGLLPLKGTFGTVPLLGHPQPWWLPLLLVGVISTAIAYATSIASTEILGSRVASFVGLLEVVAAALYAFLLLGEALTILQILGGILILAGIAFVRSDRVDPAMQLTGPIELPHLPRTAPIPLPKNPDRLPE